MKALWEEARIQGKSTKVGRQAAGDGHRTKVQANVGG